MTTRKLIVGLGNPGKKYERTRHNLGFLILDELARKNGTDFKDNAKLENQIAQIRLSGDKMMWLAKPLTFMNESGRAVANVQNFYKINLEDIWVIHDEIDLPFGVIRPSTAGGSAGHKGVESIIEALGEGFSRLRVGVENRKEYRMPETETYVLKNFSAEEEEVLQKKIIPEVVNEIEKILKIKNELHGKSAE